MESTWYLMKYDDGTVFGPISLEQLKEWAHSAQISPLDKISEDESAWSKAPTLPDLEMDFLLQVDSDQFYGPTTIGAIREFLSAGEVNPETALINCKDGSQRKIKDFPALNQDTEAGPVQDAPVPGKTNIRQSLQARIRQLEELILDERRAYNTLEERYNRLETKYEELTGEKF